MASMKGPFWTTSLSDLVLALSAFHAAYRLWPSSMCGVLSFLLIGLAATCGTYRFSQKDPGADIISYHNYLSWLASVLGMPYMAAAYYRSGNIYIMANAHLASGFAMVVLKQYLNEKLCSAVTDVVSAAAVISTLLFCCVYNFNSFGIIGTLVYGLAGLVIGTNGYMMGIPRVDLFHYALTVGNIAFMLGLSTSPRHVYYKQT